MASHLMPRPFPYNAARFRVAFRLHLAAFIGLAIAAVVLLRLSSRLLPIAYIFVIAMAMVFLLTIVNAWPQSGPSTPLTGKHSPSARAGASGWPSPCPRYRRRRGPRSVP
jgi:uncharacterized membrane protein YfcA